MIEKIEIDEIGTIWRIHYDINSDDLFIEIKYEKVFELYSVNLNKKFKLNSYDQYVQNILSVQYPFVLLSYRHIDNLLDDQIIVVYNLELLKEEWMSSDIRVDEIFNKSIKVYHPKILPKSYYYINFLKENIDNPILFKYSPKIIYANNYESIVILQDTDYEISLDFIENKLMINNSIHNYIDQFEVEEIYNADYEYLMKINNIVLLLLGKHKLNIYRINDINS